MNATGWSSGLEVTGVVSHAGLVLLRQLTDRVGLTAGLSRALPSPRGGHARGRVFCDLACAITDGARVISDFRVMGDQKEVFGQVASVPTVWRMLKEAAADGDRARRRIAAAVNKARRHEWAQGTARHGGLPPVQVADRKLDGVTCLRLDATVVTAHSEKQEAEPNFKGIDLLTELSDVSAAQAGCASLRPVIEMSERSRSPGCRSLAASPIAAETGHTELNRSAAFSSLPIFGVSRSAS